MHYLWKSGPGGPGAVPDASQVDDHRDALVAAASVPPRVLVHADHPYPVEAVRVGDQDPLAL